jgi:hypothetical protein
VGSMGMGGGAGGLGCMNVCRWGVGVTHRTTAEMSVAAHPDRSPEGVGVRASDQRYPPRLDAADPPRC